MPARPWKFHLSGGRLCLDLANTVSWRASARPIERLERAEDLVRWARQTRVIANRDGPRFVQAVRRHPVQSGRALAAVRVAREAIYRVFSALADGEAPADVDLALINEELSHAVRHLGVTRRSDGTFAWKWGSGAPTLHRLIWPAIRSAAQVLTGDDLGRLKKCPSADCGWIFLDTTRNGTRRWCAMTVCGNRAKARRYYARQRVDTVGRRSPAANRPAE
jgi:predicted RNA-binding Zn ribbon-like protein